MRIKVRTKMWTVLEEKGRKKVRTMVRTKVRPKVRAVFEAKGRKKVRTKVSTLAWIVLKKKVRTRAGRR